MMRPLNKLNENRKVMLVKFMIYFLLITLIYEIPSMTNSAFSPLSFILNYEGSLKEWLFRSRLDHYVTFLGMICAYNHPNIEKALRYINSHRLNKLLTAFISSILLFIVFFWHKFVFTLGKYDYNKLHPYTSLVPLLTFIYLRNCTTWLRRRYIMMFTFLGKITLETYISQLHIYLQSNAKAIIVYIPGYPLVNFAINSVIYLYMAQLLFKATVTLNEYIFPTEYKKMWWNLIVIVTMVITSYLINLTLKII